MADGHLVVALSNKRLLIMEGVEVRAAAAVCVPVRVCGCVCVNMCAYAAVCSCARMWMCVYVYMWVFVCAYVRVFPHLRVCFIYECTVALLHLMYFMSGSLCLCAALKRMPPPPSTFHLHPPAYTHTRTNT